MDSNQAIFPDEMVEPSEKAKKSYGLKVGQAIWFHHHRYGSPLFANRARDLHEIEKYILGLQNVNDYKPVAGVDPLSSDTDTFVKGIYWDIKSYATKRFNVAVSKITQPKYEPTIDAVDANAIDMKSTHEAMIRVLMQNREELEAAGMLEQFLPPNLTAEDLPTTIAQLEMYMQDYKLFAASVIEEGIKEHLNDNDYDQIRREVAQDLIKGGLGVVDTYMDDNILPALKKPNIAQVIVPKSEYEDFRDIKYFGYLDFLSFSDLEKESQRQFTKEELRDIKETATQRNSHLSELASGFYNTFDDVIGKIPVMRFRWKTTDVQTYAQKIDLAGNPKLYPKKNNYKGNNKKVQHKQNSIYEGVWIVGTDYIYNYRKRHFTIRKRGFMNEAPLGVAIFAPNMMNHKLVSAGEQMIPVLKELQTYNVKLRHMLSHPFPNGVKINLKQLKDVSFKWGSKKFDAADIVNFFVQKKILVSEYEPRQGTADEAVEALNLGEQIQDYVLLIQNALRELDEILGLNPASVASGLGERTTARTTQLQMQATDTALDYLFYADKKIYLEVCKNLAVLHAYAQKFGKKGRFNHILGKIGSYALDESFDLTKHDYSFDLETSPTQEEWQGYYADIEKAVSAGILMPSDAAMLRRVDSLKKGEMQLRRLENIRERKAAEKAKADQEFNIQSQQASAQSASEGRVRELEMEMQVEEMKGRLEMAKQKQEFKLKKELMLLQKDLEMRNKEAQIEDETLGKIAVERSKPKEKNAKIEK